MRKLPLILLVCCLALPLAALAGESLAPEDLLGPKPGFRFHYEGNGGLKMRIEGLAWDREGALIVKRTMIFPREAKPDSGCINELTEVYGIVADETRLLTKGLPESAASAFVVELDTEKPVWSNPVTSATGEKTAGKCRIVSTHREFLFGKERVVMETDGELCIPCAYASGIGLIRYIDLKLVRIERFDQPVTAY
jgi:hypothetical protein